MLPYANEAKKNYEEEEEPYDPQQAKDVTWFHHVMLNRPLKVVLIMLLFVVVGPISIYNYFFTRGYSLPPSDGYSSGSCLLPRTARLPCGLENVSDTECHSQCCYDYQNHLCFHRFPSRFSYITDQVWSEDIVLQPRISTVPFKNQNSIPTLRISFDELSSTHITLKIYNPSVKTEIESRRIEEKDFNYHVASPESNIMINRTDGTNIFSTIRGPIIASDNIWEIAFKLTEEIMFGLGEIPLNDGTVKVIYSHREGLSSIPLIYAKANNSFHGVLIDVKEPTEVSIRGENQIVIRSITKSGLKLHLFTGPQPIDIMKDITNLIGTNNDLEYWMLGAHICSETSETPDEAITDMSTFLRDASTSNLPFDSHCGATPLVFDNNFCKEDSSLETSAQLIRDAGKKFVPHISPYLRYESEEGSTTNTIESISTTTTSEDTDFVDSTPTTSSTTVDRLCTVSDEYEGYFLKHDENVTYSGKVGDDYVIYPDYKQMDKEFLNKLLNPNITFDGVSLVDNWPLDESDKDHENTNKILPYFSTNFEKAFNNTPTWNIKNSNGEDYIYNHNEYGNDFAKYFRKSFTEIPVFSTAQWMNGEVAVNRQNIDTLWSNLHKELIEGALGSISGHRLWSSPVCGDTEHYNSTTQQSLCVKWYMAATYMPLIKIHSKGVRRDPLSFTGNNRGFVITALKRRSSLLPYFYTMLQKGPLLRPMFYQFPESAALQSLNTQFAVGDALLIVQNLQPSQSHVHVKLPPGAWYEFWGGLHINGTEGQTVTMTTTESDFLTFVRGGSIVVLQKDVKLTASETQLQSHFTLIVALECENSRKISGTSLDSEIIAECNAEGSLYVTESLTLRFQVNSASLVIRSEGEDFSAICDQHERKWANFVQDIIIYGLEDRFNNFDHYRSITVSENLCDLETSDEIVISLLI